MQMKNVLSGVLCAIICQATGAFAGSVCTETICDVPVNATVAIERHGVCRLVKNLSTAKMAVPTASPAEWNSGKNSFLSAMSQRNDVKIQNCPDPINPYKLIATGKCPSAYGRMFCGGSNSDSMVAADGTVFFMYEDGDSGQTIPKIHVYRVDEAGVSLVTSAAMTTKYPRHPNNVTVSDDGTMVVTVEWRYSDDDDKVAIHVLSFDGSTLAETWTGTFSPEGSYIYDAPVLSRNGQWLLFNRNVYQRSGKGFVLAPGSVPRGVKAPSDARWSEADQSFYRLTSSGIIRIFRDNTGTWTHSSVAAYDTDLGISSLSLSRDGSTMAATKFASVTSSTGSLFLYRKAANGSFVKKATIGSFPKFGDMALSADGKVLVTTESHQFKQYDLSGLDSGIVTEVRSTSVPSDIAALGWDRIYISASNDILITNKNGFDLRGGWAFYKPQ